MEGVVATTGLESVLGANYHRGHDLDAYIRALSDLYSSGRAGIFCLHLVWVSFIMCLVLKYWRT